MPELLGYRHDLEDHAFLASSPHSCLALAGEFEAPEELVRDWLRTERQQRNDCAGHAESSGLECGYYDATGEVTQFSPHFAYILGQREAGIRGDVGCTITGVVQAGRKYGACPLEVCPYPRFYDTRITDVMLAAAEPYKTGYHQKLTSYEEGFTFLAARQGGIVIGIPWDRQLQAGPVIEQWSYRATGSWHAVLIEGYSRRKDSRGRNYLRLRNSHGENYGVAGVVEIAPDVFDAWGRTRNIELIGISDLSAPNVRPDWRKSNYKIGGRGRRRSALPA